jgi:hypothetical protein
VLTLFLVIKSCWHLGLQKESNNSSLEMMLPIACECSVMHEQHDHDWFSALTILANERDIVECLNTDTIIDRFSLTSQKLQKHLK